MRPIPQRCISTGKLEPIRATAPSSGLPPGITQSVFARFPAATGQCGETAPIYAVPMQRWGILRRVTRPLELTLLLIGYAALAALILPFWGDWTGIVDFRHTTVLPELPFLLDHHLFWIKGLHLYPPSVWLALQTRQYPKRSL